MSRRTVSTEDPPLYCVACKPREQFSHEDVEVVPARRRHLDEVIRAVHVGVRIAESILHFFLSGLEEFI